MTNCTGVVWTGALDVIISKEAENMVISGMDAGLLRKCRVKSVKADKMGRYTPGFHLDGDFETEYCRVDRHVERYKRLWGKLESRVSEAEVGGYVNPTELDELAMELKDVEKRFIAYAYPTALAKAVYYANRELSNVFTRLPLLLKVLLASPI